MRNFTDFALFISFFPHLVAGPIIRPENFFPQLQGRISPGRHDLRWGLCEILKGLLKKMVFADYFAVVSDAYFNSPDTSSVAPAIGVVAFAMQIYFDFAGYTDIARGCAALMGFRFPSNFERPYLATDIADFWRRWHISLSTWLRDYLYIPLGGNRVKALRVYVNLMIVMALGGLWHGASWNFMAWGAAHGAMLCMHRLWTRTIGNRMSLPAPFCWALTFILVTIAWVPFRAADFATTATVLKQLFSVSILSTAGAAPQYWALLGVAIFWCLIDQDRRIQRWLVDALTYGLMFAPIAVALLFIQVFGQFDLQIPFIYFKF